MAEFTIKVNGEDRTVDVSGDTPLLWVLRDHLNLVGTKFGCGIAQCGACSVHMDGEVMRSCILPLDRIGDSKITTIEGLSPKCEHPLQKAWIEHDVPQCGYCQAGQIMTAAALLDTNNKPTDEEIDKAMAGNICRCSAYIKIKDAIKSASNS